MMSLLNLLNLLDEARNQVSIHAWGINNDYLIKISRDK